MFQFSFVSRPLTCLFLLATALATLSSARAQTKELTPQEHMEKLIGTWVITRVNVEGVPITHNYQIKRGAEEGDFEHVWRVTGDAEAYIVNAAEGNELRIKTTGNSHLKQITLNYEF